MGEVLGLGNALSETLNDTATPFEVGLEHVFWKIATARHIWIVLDNLEDVLEADGRPRDSRLTSFLERVMQLNHSLHLIVTSRALPSFAGVERAVQLHLDPALPEEAAMDYLLAEVPQAVTAPDREILKDFANRVHGVPAALNFAVLYLRRRQGVMSLKDLLDEPAYWSEFEARDVEQGLRRLIHEQYEQLSVDEQIALSVLSVFRVPVELAGLRHILPALDWEATLGRLTSNRVALAQDRTYDLHPLWRDCVYRRIPAATGDVEMPFSLEEKQRNEEHNLPKYTNLRFSRKSLHTWVARFYSGVRKMNEQQDDRKDADLRPEEVHHLYEAGQYEEAYGLAQQLAGGEYSRRNYRSAHDYRKMFMGKLNDAVAESENLLDMADIARAAGRPRMALQYSVNAFGEIKERMLEPFDADVLDILIRLDDHLPVSLWDIIESYAGQDWEQHIDIADSLYPSDELNATLAEGYYFLDAYVHIRHFWRLAKWHREQGHPERGAAILRDVRGHISDSAEYDVVGPSLGELGECLLTMGDTANAIAVFVHLERRSQEEEDYTGVAKAQLGLERCLRELAVDNVVRCVSGCLEAAEDYVRGTDDTLEKLEVICGIARLKPSIFDEAVELARRCECLEVAARVAGDIAAGLSEGEDAEPWWTRGLDLVRESQLAQEVVAYLRRYAAHRRDRQASEEATALLEEALVIAKEARKPRLEAEVLNDLSSLMKVSGRLKEAIECLERSRSLAEHVGDVGLHLEVLTELHSLCSEAGDQEQASKYEAMRQKVDASANSIEWL